MCVTGGTNMYIYLFLDETRKIFNIGSNISRANTWKQLDFKGESTSRHILDDFK